MFCLLNICNAFRVSLAKIPTDKVYYVLHLLALFLINFQLTIHTFMGLDDDALISLFDLSLHYRVQGSTVRVSYGSLI